MGCEDVMRRYLHEIGAKANHEQTPLSPIVRRVRTIYHSSALQSAQAIATDLLGRPLLSGPAGNESERASRLLRVDGLLLRVNITEASVYPLVNPTSSKREYCNEDMDLRARARSF